MIMIRFANVMSQRGLVGFCLSWKFTSFYLTYALGPSVGTHAMPDDLNSPLRAWGSPPFLDSPRISCLTADTIDPVYVQLGAHAIKRRNLFGDYIFTHVFDSVSGLA
ncbi:hypothetical protein M404DRAFT_995449 [Pisolithus tinctorius Marx 270]|uniref:Uncharacterized protein n=1 Tax=Pisolithus tinctorius Marx 270 TaxID=870435 RepID=A0A0C3KKX5_PISTI|nr:hypothetical protein M404DRAFT_995449 [Pisolithus tinctorius Marx 270]